MKIVQLPRKVWVSSYEFPLRITEHTDPVLEDNDGMTVTGEHDRGIWISSVLDTRRRLETVLHELTHAINWAYDIDDGVEEEMIGTKHGIGWSQFWLDNPRAVAWLVYTLEKIRREQRTPDEEVTMVPKVVAV